MKKLGVYGVAAVVVVGAITGAVVLWHKNKSANPTDNASNTIVSKGYNVVAACRVLTLDDAKQVLGNAAKASNSNGIGDTENADVKVTNCSYTSGVGTGSDFTTIGLLVRAAKTKAGGESNKAVFVSNKPAGINDVQHVQGFGDAAFWDQSKGQLNILKHNNWYIVSKLVGAHPDQAKQSDVEQVAKRIMERM
jgi:hypothetical protein